MSKEGQEFTVKPTTRGERQIVVKKYKPGQKSKIIPFDDIDKVEFKVTGTSTLKAKHKDEQGKQNEYLQIDLKAKMPNESARDLRVFEFCLPSEMVSPTGVMVGRSYSLSVALNIKEEWPKAIKEKFMGMRERLLDALVKKFFDIAGFMGFATADDNGEDLDKKAMRALINSKLNKIIKPPKKSPTSDVHYMNMDCKFTSFVHAEVYKGKYTGDLKKLERDDLIDKRVTHTSKARLPSMRCIPASMGIPFQCIESMVDKVEACTQELEMEDVLAAKMASGMVNDVGSQMDELKNSSKANEEDAMVNAMAEQGNLNLKTEEEKIESSGEGSPQVSDDEDFDPMK